MAKVIAEAELTIYEKQLQLLPLDRLRRKRKPEWVTARSTLSVLQRYWNARRDLLATELKDVRHLAPAHYTEDRAIMVVCFSDGVVARYEIAEGTGVVIGTCDLPLSVGIRAMSDNVIVLLEDCQ